MDELTQIETDSHHGDDKSLSIDCSKVQRPENHDIKKLQGIWKNERSKSFGPDKMVSVINRV